MLPAFLVPETTIYESGMGTVLELDPELGEEVAGILLTLGINRVVEQESLAVTIQGSADGVDWSAAPLAAFPQKYYTGVSSILLNLQAHPGTKYLRARWAVNRWGRGGFAAVFDFYVFAEAITAG